MGGWEVVQKILGGVIPGPVRGLSCSVVLCGSLKSCFSIHFPCFFQVKQASIRSMVEEAKDHRLPA